MKKILLSLLITASAFSSRAQEALKLGDVLEQARQNYPLLRQDALLKESLNLNIANQNRGYLPQLSINGQASYQSDVTEVPIRIPAFQFEPLSLEQYRMQADLSQVLYDGGNIERQKKVLQQSTNVEKEKLNVEFQQLRERIRKIYLSILLTDEQISQTKLVDNDLEAGIKRMEAAVKNGTALRSQLSLLQAELLKNKQRRTELEAGRETLLSTLGLYTGKQYEKSTLLEMPQAPLVDPGNNNISRPELSLIFAQDSLTKVQRRMLSTRSLPKLSLFAQGGYGRPALNMLENEFNWYYIAGARLIWNLGPLYTLGKEKKLNSIQQSSIGIQRDIYLLNTNATVLQYRDQISKYSSFIGDDEEIILLRDDIRKAAKAQLDNGVITSDDYIREVNAADQARRTLTLHKLQLLQAQLEYADYFQQQLNKQ